MGCNKKRNECDEPCHCHQMYDAACMRYTGSDLECLDHKSGDMLESILKTIDKRMCEVLDGSDGVGIEDITFSLEEGTITIILTNGETYTSPDLRGNSGDYLEVNEEPAGENCSNGGYLITLKSGADDSTISENYICNGDGSGQDCCYEELTYSELSTLQTDNLVEPNTMYNITDRGIFVKGLSLNEVSQHGSRLMRVPQSRFYEIQTIEEGGITLDIRGIYGQTETRGTYPNSTASNSIYVIWGGKLWRRNNSGSDAGELNDIQIGDGWTLQDETGGLYETKVFSVEYDVKNDWVSKQTDWKGNTIGVKHHSDISFNPVDHTDWNTNLIYDNQIDWGVYNNFRNDTEGTLVTGNSIRGKVSNNVVRNVIANVGGEGRPSSTAFINTLSGVYNNVVASTVGIDTNHFTIFIRNNTLSGTYTGIQSGSAGIERNYTHSIEGNTCSIITGNRLRSIQNNSVSGGIVNNKQSGAFPVGRILSNEGEGNIEGNTFELWIFNNTLHGDIYNNKAYQIRNNNINGDISSNKCKNLSYNTINGEITGNNIVGQITNNLNYKESVSFVDEAGSEQNIRFNTNNGDITGNYNVGDIEYNSNTGNISDNANNRITSTGPYNGDIMNITYNLNAGNITNNRTKGDISFNTNNGDIINNHISGSGNAAREILNNSNGGNIENNLIAIRHNSNGGAIVGNSYLIGFQDITYISNNNNNGVIKDNTLEGVIEQNKNNGDIEGNKSIAFSSPYQAGDSPLTIYNNVNNGYISFNEVNDNALVEIKENASSTGNIGGVAGTPITRTVEVSDTITHKTS